MQMTQDDLHELQAGTLACQAGSSGATTKKFSHLRGCSPEAK
jgi:hypothetical protein